jgi:D-serine deaminase-like pyridoxal phosphate-dependent protein
MTTLDALPTPLIVVDQPTMLRNIDRMQARASTGAKGLRPHGKTHKSPEIARAQVAAGAIGLCCAKPGEAEVFVGGGVEDIRLAYPVQPVHADRLIALMDRARVSFIVDDLDVATAWSEAARQRGVRFEVLAKIDVGFHRCGFDPDHQDLRGIVRALAALPGLELRGLLSHAGQAYLAASSGDIGAIVRQEAELLARIQAEALVDGLPLDEISVGSTPSAADSMEQAAVTEVRPGNYVFCDRTQVALGSATWQDCALTVIASVVSAPAPDRVIFDCGSKVLSSDGARGFVPTPGFGVVLGADGQPDTTVLIERLSEEHATVRVTGTPRLRIGDRVRIVPNHACVVANLTSAYVVADGNHVVEHLPVAARGRVV